MQGWHGFNPGMLVGFLILQACPDISVIVTKELISCMTMCRIVVPDWGRIVVFSGARIKMNAFQFRSIPVILWATALP
jgi:hypothetical protein